MPSQPTPPIQRPGSDLAARAAEVRARAAEVRRLQAQQEAEHRALELALSMICREHGAGPRQPCYPPPSVGVCGDRAARALGMARARRAGKQQREARR